MAEISKTQRWLDLIAYLVGRRLPVSVEEIMERVPSYAAGWKTGDEKARASARRAFERDKDELREQGIPIRTVPYTIDYGGERVQGYRIARRDFYLPYLKLVEGTAGRESGMRSEPGAGPLAGGATSSTRHADSHRVAELEIAREDAGAALEALSRVAELPDFPLAAEARSAFRKLAFDLDVDRFRETPLLFADRAGAGDVQRTLRLVSEALLARKRVRFVYRGIYRDRETRRDVAPYGLFFQGGHWYLVGHDVTREDLRVFRAERMREVSPNPARPRTPDYEIPGDFRLEDHLRKEAWELGGEDEEPLVARVLFPFPRSLWAERNGHGRLLEEREDGSAVRAFQVRQVNPFLRWMLSLEGEAELLEPRELRRELGELAGAVVALYEEDGTASPAEPGRAGSAGADSEDSSDG